MILNQQLEWTDVRFQISRRTSYDKAPSFDGRPAKEYLLAGTVLYRLDFPVLLGIFAKVWWMKEAVFHRSFDRAGGTPSGLRQELQNSQSLPRPAKAQRTQVLVIVTTQPVFAWVGTASPLFHKPGGDEQVYLPNLAHGSGMDRSEHARLLRTYTLPTA